MEVYGPESVPLERRLLHADVAQESPGDKPNNMLPRQQLMDNDEWKFPQHTAAAASEPTQ